MATRTEGALGFFLRPPGYSGRSRRIGGACRLAWQGCTVHVGPLTQSMLEAHSPPKAAAMSHLSKYNVLACIASVVVQGVQIPRTGRSPGTASRVLTDRR